MSLPAKLDAFKADFDAGKPPYNVPRSVIETMHRATAELIASGAASRAKKVGDEAPGFSLKDPEGNIVGSAELLKKGPLIVSFYRGVWCPYRLADKGWTRSATAFAILTVAAAFLMTHLAADGSGYSLALLITAAILLSFGMTANLTLGQRAIFVLASESRGRLNGLCMSAFFVAGAASSALGGPMQRAVGPWRLGSD